MVFLRYNENKETITRRMKAMDNASGFEEIAHTADWALRVWAPNLSGLMLAAVRGMYSLSDMTFLDEIIRKVQFSLQAFDEGSLLVEFLNEVLFYAENELLGMDDIRLKLDGNSVRVAAFGKKILRQKKEIKAVTYHNLEIKRTAQGLETILIFDV